jgi:predicted enzyme related to lactoylglutathione lyase
MTSGTPSARLAMVTIDCGEVKPVAEFWAAMMGYDIVANTDDYAMLRGAEGAAVGFGRVPDYQAPGWPNERGSKQYHFDLAVDDVDEAADRAVELGATLAEPQPGETWRVLLDPAGHPFCLTNAANWG